MVNFYMETTEAAPLLFCWKPGIQETRMGLLYSPPFFNQTHPKSTTKIVCNDMIITYCIRQVYTRGS
jgi:hypothetical protein